MPSFLFLFSYIPSNNPPSEFINGPPDDVQSCVIWNKNVSFLTCDSVLCFVLSDMSHKFCLLLAYYGGHTFALYNQKKWQDKTKI